MAGGRAVGAADEASPQAAAAAQNPRSKEPPPSRPKPVMANYLITGVSGSGKSTIGRELRRRGYSVVETDRVWGRQILLPAGDRDPRADPHTVPPPEHPAYVRGEAWVWDTWEVRRDLEKKSPVRFFVGGADNEFPLYDLFDRVFLLDTEVQYIIDRLKQRKNDPTSRSDYISKTQREIFFRSRFSDTENFITVHNPDNKANHAIDLISVHISESTFEHGVRTLRVMLGLPRLLTLADRGVRVWRRFRRYCRRRLRQITPIANNTKPQ